MARPPIMKATGEFKTMTELMNEGLDYQDITVLEEEGVIKRVGQKRVGWLIGLPVMDPLFEMYDMC